MIPWNSIKYRAPQKFQNVVSGRVLEILFEFFQVPPVKKNSRHLTFFLGTNPVPAGMTIWMQYLTLLMGCQLLSGNYCNISHLGKKTILFKHTLNGDMLVPRRVCITSIYYIHLCTTMSLYQMLWHIRGAWDLLISADQRKQMRGRLESIEEITLLRSSGLVITLSVLIVTSHLFYQYYTKLKHNVSLKIILYSHYSLHAQGISVLTTLHVYTGITVSMILVTCCCECWMIVVVRARHVLVMLLRIDFYCWTQKQGGNKSNTAVNYVVLSLWTVYDTAQTPGTFQAACFLEQSTRKWKNTTCAMSNQQSQMNPHTHKMLI